MATYLGPSNPHDQFASALQITKRRLKTISLLAAGFTWLAATGLFVALFVAGDHWLPSGVPDRLGLAARLLFGLASLAWLTLAILVPTLRRIHDLYAARLIERSYPEFGNTLVDAVQLTRHEELPGSVREAILDRAAVEVEQVDVQASVPSHSLRRRMWASAGVLGALAVYALVAPKSVWVSVGRAFGLDAPPPTWTLIAEVFPPDGTSVLRGEAVRFGARLQGRRPETAYVRFSFDGGATWQAGQQLALRPPPDAATATWQGVKAGQDVQHSMIWQLVADDANSALRRLEVRDLPEVASIDVRLDYPPYTRLAPTTQPTGDVDALVGTRAAITAITNVPARDPILVMGAPPGEMRRILNQPVREARCEVAADFIVREDSSYHLEFSDMHGQPSLKPIRWSIRARPDTPPLVEVLGAREQFEADATEVIEIAARIEDDFGLTRAAVAFRRPGDSAARELPMTLPPNADEGRAEVHGRLDLAQTGAAPGETIEWWVSAWDNREDPDRKPAYQRGDSTVRRVLIRRPVMLASSDQARGGPVAPPPASNQPSPPNSRSTASAPAEPNTDSDPTTDDAGDPTDSRVAQASPPRKPENQPPPSSARNQETPADASEPPSAQAAQGDRRQGENADQDEAAPTEPDRKPPESIEEFKRRHAREFRALSKHLGDKAAPPAASDGTEPPADPGEQERPAVLPGDATSPDAPASRDHAADGRKTPDESRPATAPGDETGERAEETASPELDPGGRQVAPGNPLAESDRLLPPPPAEPTPGADAARERAPMTASPNTRPASSPAEEDADGTLRSGPNRGSRNQADTQRDRVETRGLARGERDPNGSSRESRPADGQDHPSDASGDSSDTAPQRAAESSAGQDGQRADQPAGREAASPTSRATPGQAPSASQDPNGDPGSASGRNAEASPIPSETPPAGDARGSAPPSGAAPAAGTTAAPSNQAGPPPGPARGRSGSNPSDEASPSTDNGPAEAPGGQPGTPDESTNPTQGQGPGQTPGQGAGPSPGNSEGTTPAAGQGQAPGNGQGRPPGPGEGRQPGTDPGQKPGPGQPGAGEPKDPTDKSGQPPAKPPADRAGEKPQNQPEEPSSGDSPPGAADAPPSSATSHPNTGAQPGGSEGGSEAPSRSPGEQSSGGATNQEGGRTSHRDKGGQGGAVAEADMIELPDRAAAADGEVRPPAATDRAPADLKADGRVDALMDALERDLRSGEIDEALLIELNWTPAQARAFVESYKRLKTGGQRQVAKTKLPGRPESANEARPPDNTVLRGKDSGSTGARGLHTTHSRSPDDTRELLEVGRQRVGPKYQSVLQAYYRSLATRPAGAAPMRGGSPSATPPG